jgi:hypothetical protein
MTAKKAAKTATSTRTSDAADKASAPAETTVVAETDEIKIEKGEVSDSLASRVNERFRKARANPKPSEGPKGSSFKPVRTLDQAHSYREDFGRFYIDKIFAGRYWKVFSKAGPVPKELVGTFTKYEIIVAAVKAKLASEE